jgi:hypothetical protein
MPNSRSLRQVVQYVAPVVETDTGDAILLAAVGDLLNGKRVVIFPHPLEFF